MTPTKDEKQWLKQHLNGLLHYSETCAEFYDHILTALEHQPNNTDFKTAVYNIIENDFGGPIGMAAIELKHHTVTTIDIQNKYRRYIRSYVNLKFLPLWIAWFALLYWVAGQAWYNANVRLITYLTFSTVVFIITAVRHLRTGFAFGNIKASVKDEGFTWIKKAPAVLFFVVIFCNLIFRNRFDPIPAKHPLTESIALSLLALHTLTFYKIYKEQFKISFI